MGQQRAGTSGAAEGRRRTSPSCAAAGRAVVAAGEISSYTEMARCAPRRLGATYPLTPTLTMTLTLTLALTLNLTLRVP